MLAKLRRLIFSHKIITLIVVIAAAGAGYYWYTSSQSTVAVTKYVVQKATQETVVASVSGSGQVQPVTQVDVKPQVTEAVTKIYVKVGDHVNAGQLLVQLDTANEEKALKQAELSLQSAQLSLAKLQEPADQLSLTQAENAVTQAGEQLVNASATLQKDYQSGFDSVAGAFVDFQTVINQLQDFVIGNEINKSQSNPDALLSIMPNYLQASTTPYRDDIVSRYQAATAAYQQNLSDYRAASHASNNAALDALFSETYTTAKLMGEAVKSAKGMTDFVTNNYPKTVGLTPLPSVVTTFQTNFGNYTGTMNSDITNLSNTVHTIASDKTALNDANLSVTEQGQSLAKLQAGANTLDVQSQQLSIQQQQFSVDTARENLNDDSIQAPIAGIISALPAVVGADVPSPAVSIVGEGKLAQVTLNEVDAAKVAVGEKATLTFDAIDGLALAGQVVEVDPVGTVTQGVVNYNVKVGFAEANNGNRVKPGMSVTANIATAVHQDVVALPNAAVQRQGSSTYVLVPAAALSDAEIAASANGGMLLVATNRVSVTTGIANDSVTEIMSGVNAGDQVIVQTIRSSSATAAARTTTVGGAFGIFGGGGVRAGGGGGVPGR